MPTSPICSGTIERWGETGKRREELRFLALVHDALKNKVQNWRPKTGENHHATRARRFAERYVVDDERLLATIEHHDRPYSLWRRFRRRGPCWTTTPSPRCWTGSPTSTCSCASWSWTARRRARTCHEPIRWLKAELGRRAECSRRAGGRASARAAAAKRPERQHRRLTQPTQPANPAGSAAAAAGRGASTASDRLSYARPKRHPQGLGAFPVHMPMESAQPMSAGRAGALRRRRRRLDRQAELLGGLRGCPCAGGWRGGPLGAFACAAAVAGAARGGDRGRRGRARALAGARGRAREGCRGGLQQPPGRCGGLDQPPGPRGSRPASSRSPHPRRCGGPQRAVPLRLRLPAAVPGQEHRRGRSRRRVWPPLPGGTRPGWRTRRRGRARCRSAL